VANTSFNTNYPNVPAWNNTLYSITFWMGPVFVVVNCAMLGLAFFRLKTTLHSTDTLFMALHWAMAAFYLLSLLFAIASFYTDNSTTFGTLYLISDLISTGSFILIVTMVNGNKNSVEHA